MSEVTLERCIFHGMRCQVTPGQIKELVRRYGLETVDRELVVLWLELFQHDIRYPASWLKKAIECSYSPQIPHEEYVREKQGKIRRVRGAAKEKALKEAYARLDAEKAEQLMQERPPQQSEFWRFVPKAIQDKLAVR
ncbi:hypothetical protein SAMN05216582_105129 [Selenomonas ruminantium]|uniref:Uncharacterized protein n=1 Tax=Selenomonas ruminantium TaxID=971 RepID=A0A1M6SXC5_SELRU|nr:hypothetical protein [Selenomonas ruminantium]SHK49300.1 hypothetical protein SAMN05216582_105129 [Selenomonas ruminantium]